MVHHSRKAESADFVDAVSGTQGIAGSADFVLVLARKRHSDDALLSVTGRDIPEGEYALHADQGMLWRLDGPDLSSASKAADSRRTTDRRSDQSLKILQVVASAKSPMSPGEVAKKVASTTTPPGRSAATRRRRAHHQDRPR